MSIQTACISTGRIAGQPKPGEPMGSSALRKTVRTPQDFVDLLAWKFRETEILFAIRAASKMHQVEQIWAAEMGGKRRANILAAAARKMDELTNMI